MYIHIKGGHKRSNSTEGMFQLVACNVHLLPFRLILLLMFLAFFSSCAPTYTVLNKGVAGNNTNDLVARVDKDVIELKPTLVVMMAGTNDMINSNKFVSYQQFSDNYSRLIEGLRAKNIRAVVMIPPPVDTGYVFQRHPRERFEREPNAKMDSAARIIRNIASANSIPMVDLNTVFRITGSPNRSETSLIINERNHHIPDGIHPTADGYRLIAREIYKCLKEHRMLKTRNRIICFGDSMTYGSFMAGMGTATGETYPAFLLQLLRNKENDKSLMRR